MQLCLGNGELNDKVLKSGEGCVFFQFGLDARLDQDPDPASISTLSPPVSAGFVMETVAGRSHLTDLLSVCVVVLKPSFSEYYAVKVVRYNKLLNAIGFENIPKRVGVQ